MCGRFALSTPIDGLRRLFGFSQIPNMAPRYNIAPNQAVLTIRAGGSRGPEAFLARWGLIPGWSKDPAVGVKMINARSETVHEKPSFRNAFQRRRCLIPADAFYEWKSLAGSRQPYRIAFEDSTPLAFAGLWERWQGADGSDVDTCSIITTTANSRLKDLHHRMPVILDQHHFDLWLNGTPSAVFQIMCPYAGKRRLAPYPVSKRINDVRNDDADLALPVDIEADPSRESVSHGQEDQMSLF